MDVSHPRRPDCGGDSAGAMHVLSRKGRSFHFASRWLDRERRVAAARLYRFCRTLDDVADGDGGPRSDADHRRAGGLIERVQRDLIRGRSELPFVVDFLQLAEEIELELKPALELAEGLIGDLGEVRVADDDELLRYAYRVAGTVGEMMARVLGASDVRAVRHAVDLGIAMQLTNVVRDVAEDARRHRCYLPASRIGLVPFAGLAAPGDEPTRLRIGRAVCDLLRLADRYYESGEAGLAYLPSARSRLGILVAARVYREIGVEVLKDGGAVWNGRTVIRQPRKLALAARAATELGVWWRTDPAGRAEAS